MKEGLISGIIFFLKSSQISAYAATRHGNKKTITENLSPVKIIYVLNFAVLNFVPRTKFIRVEHPITAIFWQTVHTLTLVQTNRTTATFFCPQGSRYGEVQL